MDYPVSITPVAGLEPGVYTTTLRSYFYQSTPWPFPDVKITTGEYTITFEVKPQTYSVIFVDYNNLPISVQIVKQGDYAIAPGMDIEAREGYWFTGWDAETSRRLVYDEEIGQNVFRTIVPNVQEDMIVTAQYMIRNYNVQFADWDGTLFDNEQQVDHGKSATAPADPTREGYTFIGWDKDFSSVTEHMVVNAQYKINTYTVTFADWDGSVIKTETVEHFATANAPADPTREGYTFTGWNTAFNYITGPLTVTAQYEINKYDVVFVDWDGVIIKEEIVEHFAYANAPANPIKAGWLFTGWDFDLENYITSDTIITAMYVPIEIAIFKPQTGADNHVYANGVYIGTIRVETKTFTLADTQVINITLDNRGQGNNTWIYNFTWELAE
jgi:uncharacterized repeat protein (TIGR02543 family)